MPRKGRGQEVSRREAADFFGVTVNTMDAWTRRGCPVVERGSRGKQWIYNTADVAEWLRETARADAVSDAPRDEKELRVRKLAAETEHRELELAEARGDVAPVEQMERMVASAFAELRTHMRNLPGRVVTALIGETNERKFKSTLLAEIDQALESLADTELVDAEDDE